MGVQLLAWHRFTLGVLKNHRATQESWDFAKVCDADTALHRPQEGSPMLDPKRLSHTFAALSDRARSRGQEHRESDERQASQGAASASGGGVCEHGGHGGCSVAGAARGAVARTSFAL